MKKSHFKVIICKLLNWSNPPLHSSGLNSRYLKKRIVLNKLRRRRYHEFTYLLIVSKLFNKNNMQNIDNPAE